MGNETPTVDTLSLPRYVLGTDVTKEALGSNPPPGMFLINLDPPHLMEQWVFDHWEPVGVWARGTAEDPFANVQIAQARAQYGAHGGGGVAPAPRPPGSPSITTPGTPTSPQGSCTSVSGSNPGATGAGTFWLDTSGGNPGVLNVRNAANTGWIAVCFA